LTAAPPIIGDTATTGTLRARSRSGFLVLVPALVGCGACVALACSQTFLWEMSERSWNVVAWFATDPDRALIYAASVFGTVVAIIGVFADDGRWSLTGAGTFVLSTVPVLFNVLMAVWFYR
jgi:hypothetical protein